MKHFLRSILPVFFFVTFFSLASACAAETLPETKLQAELAEVKTRLANVEKQQQEIVAKDNVILEKLDQLRVWVHRK